MRHARLEMFVPETHYFSENCMLVKASNINLGRDKFCCLNYYARLVVFFLCVWSCELHVRTRPNHKSGQCFVNV